MPFDFKAGGTVAAGIVVMKGCPFEADFPPAIHRVII